MPVRGQELKSKLLDEVVAILGHHRKAAIRARGTRAVQVSQARLNLVLGRARPYKPATLLLILNPIWFTAVQPCGSWLHALLPEWLPTSELDHRRIDPDVQQCLLTASTRTMDRLIAP